MTSRVVRPQIQLLWLSTVSEGKMLEISANVDGSDQAIATISADGTDESLWFEVYVGDQIVQMPLAKVQEALNAAAGNVHSESWYEKSIYSLWESQNDTVPGSET